MENPAMNVQRSFPDRRASISTSGAISNTRARPPHILCISIVSKMGRARLQPGLCAGERISVGGQRRPAPRIFLLRARSGFGTRVLRKHQAGPRSLLPDE